MQLTTKKRRKEKKKEASILILLYFVIHTYIHMDRRLHAVQDRLVEHCTQTFKSVQGSISAVTSVMKKSKPIRIRMGFNILIFVLVFSKRCSN